MLLLLALPPCVVRERASSPILHGVGYTTANAASVTTSTIGRRHICQCARRALRQFSPGEEAALAPRTAARTHALHKVRLLTNAHTHKQELECDKVMRDSPLRRRRWPLVLRPPERLHCRSAQFPLSPPNPSSTPAAVRLPILAHSTRNQMSPSQDSFRASKISVVRCCFRRASPCLCGARGSAAPAGPPRQRPEGRSR